MRARVARALNHLELCGKVTQLGGVSVETCCSRSKAPKFTVVSQRRCNATASAKQGKEVIKASEGRTIPGALQPTFFGTMRSLHVGLVSRFWVVNGSLSSDADPYLHTGVSVTEGSKAAVTGAGAPVKEHYTFWESADVLFKHHDDANARKTVVGRCILYTAAASWALFPLRAAKRSAQDWHGLGGFGIGCTHPAAWRDAGGTGTSGTCCLQFYQQEVSLSPADSSQSHRTVLVG